MKGPSNSLFHRVSTAGLLDETMQRFRAKQTLKDIADWLGEQGIQTDIATTHRLKKNHFDEWLLTKAGIEIDPSKGEDLNLDTIRRLSVLLNREVRGLSDMAEISRFVQTYAKFNEILMSRKADARAEHDARRKMAMRILDMLDSEERLAKVKDADSQARAEGLEARIANISERIWGDVFGKAA
jgi:hypothetical protein